MYGGVGMARMHGGMGMGTKPRTEQQLCNAQSMLLQVWGRPEEHEGTCWNGQ